MTDKNKQLQVISNQLIANLEKTFTDKQITSKHFNQKQIWKDDSSWYWPYGDKTLTLKRLELQTDYDINSLIKTKRFLGEIEGFEPNPEGIKNFVLNIENEVKNSLVKEFASERNGILAIAEATQQNFQELKENLEKELKEKQRTIEASEIYLKQSEQEVISLENELVLLKNKLIEYENKSNPNLNGVFSHNRRSIQSNEYFLNRSLGELSKELKENNDKYSTIIEGYEENITELEKELENQIKVMDNNQLAWEAKVTRLQSDLNRANISLNRLKDEKESALKIIAKWQDDDKERDSDIKKRKEVYDQKSQEVVILKNSINNFNTRIESLETSLERRKREIDDLNAQLANKNQQINNLENDLKHENRKKKVGTMTSFTSWTGSWFLSDKNQAKLDTGMLFLNSYSAFNKLDNWSYEIYWSTFTLAVFFFFRWLFRKLGFIKKSEPQTVVENHYHTSPATPVYPTNDESNTTYIDEQIRKRIAIEKAKLLAEHKKALSLEKKAQTIKELE